MSIKGIAVLSDVHSNVFALDAVLSDIAERGIDTIVNLGDVLFGPIAPLETAERLMANRDIVSIMGARGHPLLSRNAFL